MNDYQAFLESKRLIAPSVGFEVAPQDLSPALFDFQATIVRWALKKGRAAVFAYTGLGKTIMQLEWARLVAEYTGLPVLILAPLAVAQQTVSEGEKFGIPVTLCRSQADMRPGVNIANYEMLHHLDPQAFGGVVLDESSILKNFSGVIKRRLIEAFRQTPFRLCCTATPAPNDTVELCNHADFLGVMSPQEMVSIFFTPKGQDSAAGHFRLKAHARKHFWRWMASWSISLRRPSDLGFADEGFALPPLRIKHISVATDWKPEGQLFFTGLKGVTDRAQVRRSTLEERGNEVVRLVAEEPEEQWLLWCGLNDEGRAIRKLLTGAVEVQGPDTPEVKAAALQRFAAGDIRYLVTKPSIAGMGMNFQACARMAFVGLGDSFEAYFQALRRCWRLALGRQP